MRKTIEVTAGGDKYLITNLGATQGMRLLHTVLKASGPAVQDALANTAKMSEAQIIGLIVSALGNIPADTLDNVYAQFAAQTRYVTPTGAELEFARLYEDHFAGRYRALTEWLIEHVRLNFADFFASGASG